MFDPNGFAYFSLVFWPLVAVSLFSCLSPTKAIVATILGAQLLLPVGAMIKVTALPAIDKISVATIPALIGWLACRETDRPRPERFRIINILILLYLLSPL